MTRLPFRLGSALIMAALLIWRAASLPVTSLWRDWLAVLAIYGLFKSLFRREGGWPALATSVAAYLLGLYVFGQVPHALGLYGPRP